MDHATRLGSQRCFRPLRLARVQRPLVAVKTQILITAEASMTDPTNQSMQKGHFVPKAALCHAPMARGGLILRARPQQQCEGRTLLLGPKMAFRLVTSIRA